MKDITKDTYSNSDTDLIQVNVFEEINSKLSKTNNILTALIMVVNSSTDEAIQIPRDKIEKLSYELVETVWTDKRQSVEKVEALIFHVNVLKIKGLIGDMNFEVLMRGLNFLSHSLNSFIELESKMELMRKEMSLRNLEQDKEVNQEIARSESKVKDINLEEFNLNDLNIESASSSPSALTAKVKDINLSTSKMYKETKVNTINTSSINSNGRDSGMARNVQPRNSLTGNLSLKELINSVKDRKVSEIDSSRDRQSSRREEILKLVSHDPISIKDISNQIAGCSEKTIQRELNSLVDMNIIERIGERRWSKYILK